MSTCSPRSTSSCRGFTITDLLAVLACTALLLLLAIPACDQSSTSSSSSTTTSVTHATNTPKDNQDGMLKDAINAPTTYLGILGKQYSQRDRLRVQNNLKQAGQSLAIINIEHNGMPKFESLTDLANQYDRRGVLAQTLYIPDDPGKKKPSGSFTIDNLSFAFLHPQSNGWKNNHHATPWVSDRLIDGQGSLWGKPWQGFVVWGDGHVTFEKSQKLDVTSIGGNRTQDDDLFSGDVETDAVMIHR